jgi:FdrA protein
MTRQVEVRSGSYRDSVGLMQVSRDLRALTGVSSALVAMATEPNVDLLVSMGFEQPTGLGPNDMIVAIEADSTDAVTQAREALDSALAAGPAAAAAADSSADVPPLSITAAARRTPSQLALISTPGRVAAIDAADALAAGLDTMIFSDNVSVEHEVMLKEMAATAGLLLMGPDCGTAVVDGVGLGFANVVRPGPVGIVAASGTGAQHLMTLLDGAGIGVSHCLGVGGRDLSADVRARSTLVALDRLDADETVSTIVVVSKPPATEVADIVTAHAQRLTTAAILGYLGAGQPDLTMTAERVTAAVGLPWVPPRRWGGQLPAPRQGFVRGLFVGGTLCDEAMLITTTELGSVASNIPVEGGRRLDDTLAASGHTFIDFGDDTLTVGRPHPMIDPSLRLERLQQELADPTCAVVLLDIVLGLGAHLDPASDIAALIGRYDTPVVVALVGTRDDPQDLEAQAATLVGAGAVVHASNAAATRDAIAVIQRSCP